MMELTRGRRGRFSGLVDRMASAWSGRKDLRRGGGTETAGTERSREVAVAGIAGADDGGARGNFAIDMLWQLVLVPWIGVLPSLVIISAVISFLSPYFFTWNNILGTVALYFSWICITGFGAGTRDDRRGPGFFSRFRHGARRNDCALVLNAGYVSGSRFPGALTGVAVGL